MSKIPLRVLINPYGGQIVGFTNTKENREAYATNIEAIRPVIEFLERANIYYDWLRPTATISARMTPSQIRTLAQEDYIESMYRDMAYDAY